MSLGIPDSKTNVIAPDFISPLSPITVDEGHPLRLRCEVSCRPISEILWSRDGKPLRTKKGGPTVATQYDSGIVTSTLVIEKSSADDEGVYECKAVNESGTCVSSANVDVTKSQDNVKKRGLLATVWNVMPVINHQSETHRIGTYIIIIEYIITRGNTWISRFA